MQVTRRRLVAEKRWVQLVPSHSHVSFWKPRCTAEEHDLAAQRHHRVAVGAAGSCRKRWVQLVPSTPMCRSGRAAAAPKHDLAASVASYGRCAPAGSWPGSVDPARPSHSTCRSDCCSRWHSRRRRRLAASAPSRGRSAPAGSRGERWVQPSVPLHVSFKSGVVPAKPPKRTTLLPAPPSRGRSALWRRGRERWVQPSRPLHVCSGSYRS